MLITHRCGTGAAPKSFSRGGGLGPAARNAAPDDNDTYVQERKHKAVSMHQVRSRCFLGSLRYSDGEVAQMRVNVTGFREYTNHAPVKLISKSNTWLSFATHGNTKNKLTVIN